MNFVRRYAPRSLLIAASSLLLLNAHAASANDNVPPASTATRPAKELPEQKSTPNTAPPATRTQTTGESNQDPTVQKMNEDAQQKINREGK